MELEEAKKQCKSFARYLKTDLRDEENEDNFLLMEAIEIVLKELEEKERLYIKTLAKGLNETIENREKNKEDLDLLNEGWKIREKELLEKLENSVSKDVIREKIKECKKNKKKISNEYNYSS